MFWSIVAEAAASVPVDEVLAVAITFCRADEPGLRATGAGLVAELGDRAAEDALGVLEPLLGREDDLDVTRIALHGVAATRLAGGIPIAGSFACITAMPAFVSTRPTRSTRVRASPRPRPPSPR